MSSIPFPCPSCGASYELTSDYVEQYGGGTTTCEQCKGDMVIPHAPAASAMPPPLPIAARNASDGGGAGTLGYATPGYLATAGPQALPLWREGGTLVARKDVVFPPNCVKCNAPAEGPPLRRTYYWHSPALYILIFVALLIYAIVALCVREKGTVQIHLCKTHRAKRRNAILMGLGLVLAGIASFVAAAIWEEFLLVPPGIIVLLIGAIWASRAANVLSPKKIDKHFLHLKGAGTDFLAPLSTAGAYAPGVAGPAQNVAFAR